jgi:hypothetical protein
VDDKMYDSRRGLGIFYRWKPRNVQFLCTNNGVMPKVQRSVFERIARGTEGYAPGSVPADPEVVSTTQPPAVMDAIRQLISAHHGAGGPLIEREATTQWMGRWSYRLFVYSVIATALFTLNEILASRPSGPRSLWEVLSRSASAIKDAPSGTQNWRDVALVGWDVAANIVGTFAGFKWLGFLAEALSRHPWLLLWLAFALLLGLFVDRRLDRRYSEFWNSGDVRLKLRKLVGLG